MIGNGVGIDRVVRCRRLDLRYWGGHQFPGAHDVGLAAQPNIASATTSYWPALELSLPFGVPAKRAARCYCGLAVH